MFSQIHVPRKHKLATEGRFVIAGLTLLLVVLASPLKSIAQETSDTAKKVIQGKHIKIQIYDKNGEADTIIKEYEIYNGGIDGEGREIQIEKNMELVEELTEEAMEIMEEQLEAMEEEIEMRMEGMEDYEAEIEDAMEDAEEAMRDAEEAKGDHDVHVLHRHIEEIHERHHDEKTRVKTVQQSWFVMDLGWNVWLTDNTFDLPENYNDMELDRGASVNFHLGIIQQGVNLYKGRLRFVYGVGIEYNNYRFKKDVDLIDDSKPLDFTINSDRNYKKNKLVSQYATMPLMLNYKTVDDEDHEAFKLSAGVQLGYLIGSHTKQKWGEDGRKEKSKNKGDYSFQDYRIGYVVQFGYGDFNIFGKYYPTEVFKSGQGPVANTACLGLVLTPF